MNLRVTTKSGAIYLIDMQSRQVTGGSRDLENGRILNIYLEVGSRLLIDIPEQAEQDSDAALVSSQIVTIEHLDEDGEVVQVYE